MKKQDRAILRDLCNAYKDINTAYIKFMRPWNSIPKTADSMMDLINMETMKNAIEGCMKCWLGGIGFIKNKSAGGRANTRQE